MLPTRLTRRRRGAPGLVLMTMLPTLATKRDGPEGAVRMLAIAVSVKGRISAAR
jgi:hypothetical protein